MENSSYSNMLSVIKDALASMATESLQSSFIEIDVLQQMLDGIIEEQSRITARQLPLILDALAGMRDFLKSEASTSLSNCLANSVDTKSITAAFRVAQPYLSPEQQKECSDLSAGPVSHFTFERIVSLLMLLCTVLSLIHGYKDDAQKEREFELKERTVVAIERIADASEKSNAEDDASDTVDAILNGIYALGSGLEAINQQLQATDIEFQDIDDSSDMVIDVVNLEEQSECSDCQENNADAQN